MENNNQRALCQQLWARNKYLVLSHSSNIYNEIRQYLKQEVVEVSQVQEMIDHACQIPEHRGQVCNAFQHIWGYFKKKATDSERKDYMLLLDRYLYGQVSKEDEIWELRPLRNRILFVAWVDGSFVLLHHFVKKTQKTPRREIEKAKRELKDLKERGLSDEE